MSSPTPSHDGVSGRVRAAARLREQRDDLRRHVSHLEADIAALIAASRDSNADDEHDPEGQTIAYERAQLSALTRQARDHVQEVDAAIERVLAGTYGVCEVCGRSIDPARLEVRTTARTCVQHA